MSAYLTLPELLKYTTTNFCNPRTLNMRSHGSWSAFSSETIFETVCHLGLGLVQLGLVRGQPVGIFAKSSPQWLMMDLAIAAVGGISVPILPFLSHEHFEYILKDVDMKFLFVQGEDLFTYTQESDYQFKSLITYDVESNSSTITWNDLLEMGKKLAEAEPDKFDQLSSQAREDDLVSIIYTSGSTGTPKGVELTHKNLISQTHAARERIPLNATEDRVFSCLPYSHIFERMLIYYYFSSGTSIYILDQITDFSAACQEIQPTIMAVVPRILEKVYSRIQTKVQKASLFKKALGTWALQLAEDEELNLWQKAQLTLLNPLVFKKIRESLGGRLRAVISGGAALSPHLHHFFNNIGIPIYQGYGLTESSPVLAFNYPGNSKVGTVGPPFPGVEVKISENGEVLARGPNIMHSYHNRPNKTAETLSASGWLHTGDKGYFDEDGHLVISGRIREIFKTSSGKQITPIPIEHALQKIPWIDNAMIIAEGKSYVTALLIPDFDLLKQWKAKFRLSHLSDTEFLQSPQIKKEMDKRMKKINLSLGRWEQVREYRFITEPLSIHRKEVTPTLKVCREVVCHNYNTLIEEMYQEETV